MTEIHDMTASELLENDIQRQTTDGLLRFARALWSLARKPAPPWVTTPRPRTP